MSIYCTSLDFDSGDENVQPPLIYRESHVLPSIDDPRGGGFDLGYIPAFVTRTGYDDDAEDGKCWPFLRVSARSAWPGEYTVVLDLQQVDALIAELTDWRSRVKEDLS